MRALCLWLLLLSTVLDVGCSHSDRKLSFTAHTQSPIPASAKLVHSGAQYAGFDGSYGFVLEVSDEQLLEQLVSEWKLKPASPSAGGFFKFAKHPWWPSDDELKKLEENFGRQDDQNEEYWHVWHDRVHGKLYIEHGRW